MTARTHAAFALAGALGTLNLVRPDPVDGAVLVAAAVATAMLPDRMEGAVFKHRGATHRWWMAVLVVAALGVAAAVIDVTAPYAVWLAGGVALGFGMHLVADGMTRSGLPWRDGRLHLLPRWLRPRTGKVSELPFRVAAIAVTVVLAYALLPDGTRAVLEREFAAR